YFATSWAHQPGSSTLTMRLVTHCVATVVPSGLSLKLETSSTPPFVPIWYTSPAVPFVQKGPMTETLGLCETWKVAWNTVLGEKGPTSTASVLLGVQRSTITISRVLKAGGACKVQFPVPFVIAFMEMLRAVPAPNCLSGPAEITWKVSEFANVMGVKLSVLP